MSSGCASKALAESGPIIVSNIHTLASYAGLDQSRGSNAPVRLKSAALAVSIDAIAPAFFASIRYFSAWTAKRSNWVTRLASKSLDTCSNLSSTYNACSETRSYSTEADNQRVYSRTKSSFRDCMIASSRARSLPIKASTRSLSSNSAPSRIGC